MRTLLLPSGAAALTLSAALGLAGCSHDDMPGMPGMGSSGSTTSAGPGSAAPSPASPAGTPASGPHNEADVMFAQMMVPHHEQAVELSDIVLAKTGIDPRVTDLAHQIKDGQAPEVDQMTAWLTGWGASATPSISMDHDGMGSGTGDGMLTPAAIGQLKAARGTEAARLFVRGMTAHHRSAVAMAQQEQRNGQNADAKRLARSIVRDQEAQITRMERLLGDL
jgi:uncharacterized protein (DUF305 family)